MNKDLISRRGVERLQNLGNKVCVYRQCANIPVHIFAERCHITDAELEAIEKGINKSVDTALVYRIAQELGVSYADLFEADNEKYFSNFNDIPVMDYIIRRCGEVGYVYIQNKLDLKKSAFSNWRMRRYIPSPFILGNIMTLLKITPVDLEALRPAKKAENMVIIATEKKEEEPAQNVDMMSQVIQACNLYKHIETMRAELDTIIQKAQELRSLLGGN